MSAAVRILEWLALGLGLVVLESFAEWLFRRWLGHSRLGLVLHREHPGAPRQRRAAPP